MGLAILGAALGLGLLAMGSAYGIGKLGASTVESMARQPEAAGKIQTAAIVLAAMIEGFTLFAVVVIMLGVFNVTKANWVPEHAPKAEVEAPKR